MAKKQGPNLLAIQKQMLDAGRDTRMESFMQGAMGAFAVNIAEQEKAEATMQKHMEDLGGIQNIVKLPMEQRGAVEDFLRTNRDEYNTLAEQYEKTKDPAIKDQMNNIKFKFETLNSQLEQFATSKAEYMHDYEEGNLMKGGTFAKDNAFYMGMYGDPKAQFSISETGEMSFTVNGETKAFKDVGSHTLRNYEAEKNIDTLFGAAADLKVQGKHFDKARFANNFVNSHKSITKNDLQAILQTDLTGDGDKPSFMDQWASGGLADEFYQGVDKNNIKPEDINALLNDKQRGLDLMGKYVGNISEGVYGDTDTDPSVLLNNRYKQAQIDAMNKKSNDKKSNKYGFDSGKVEIPGKRGSYINQEQRISRRNSIENNENFQGAYGNYEWDEKKGGYILNGEGEPKSKWEVMNDEQLYGPNDRQSDYGLDPQSIKNTPQNSSGGIVTGGITTRMLQGEDNYVANSLNNLLPTNNPNNYSFIPTKAKYGIARPISYMAGENLGRNSVTLVDENLEPVLFNGEPIHLLTGSGGGKKNSPADIEAGATNFNNWLETQENFGLATGGNTGYNTSDPLGDN